MIKKLVRIAYAIALCAGYNAYLQAHQSIKMPLEQRNASPEITSIVESPDTTLQQKLGQLIALPLIQVKGRGPTSDAFAMALVALINSGAQIDEVVDQYDGTTRFHTLVAAPNFGEREVKTFFAHAKQALGRNYINSLLSTPNAGGQTPLFFAAEKNARVLPVLLDNYRASADTLNTQTKSGKTPLFKAAEVGNESSVRALLGRNADITLRDQSGFTAYDAAVKNGQTYVANLISAHAKSKGISNFANKYKN